MQNNGFWNSYLLLHAVSKTAVQFKVDNISSFDLIYGKCNRNHQLIDESHWKIRGAMILLRVFFFFFFTTRAFSFGLFKKMLPPVW